MVKYDVIIIGSGLGGLLCSNILSKEGFNVCLIEKNRKLGGSLQTFGRKGCIFNTGLNYTESLDNGQVLNQYFKYFNLLRSVNFQRLNADGFEIIDFNDGQYKFAMGEKEFVDTLARQFPAEKAGLKKYTSEIKRICNQISLYTLKDEDSNIFENYDLAISAAGFIQSVISDTRLQNVVAGNNLLYAGHKSKTPLLIHALINNSFIESAWRVLNGSHKLVDALVGTIRANGSTIIRGNKATKLVSEKDRISRVELSDGAYVEGKYFIANIHPENVLAMVEPGTFRRVFGTKIRSLSDTMGMFTLYIIFKRNTFPYLNYNFYHYNQDDVWITSDYRPSKWPQNYLFMNTSTTGTSLHAESGSVITYMDYNELLKWENTYTGNRGDEYLEFKHKKAETLIDAVEKQFPGIRSCIDAYYTSTPLTWRDYTGTRAGSAYGILKDCTRPLESMILPRTKIPNLFLTGQNTNVHGILGVTISSVITCSELIDMRYLIKKIRNA
jgi:all-trans-retinol 13,14-reductase